MATNVERAALQAGQFIIVANGRAPKEFALVVEQDDKQHCVDFDVVRYCVKVTHNGKTREYTGGQGRNWPVEFERDLKAARW